MTARLAAPHLFNDRRWTFPSRNDDKRTPDPTKCQTCDGTGKTWWWCDIGDGEYIRQSQRCPDCRAGNTDLGHPEGVTR